MPFVFLGLSLLIILFHDYQIDIFLMGMIFDEQHGFIYQDNFWFEKVFHKGGVLFVGAIGIGILARMGYLLKDRLKNKEKLLELGFLFCSVLISVTLIKYLKSITALPCPWNLEAFGGTRDFQPISTLFSKDYRIGYCFPSGHASAGYGFVALYFARALHRAPAKRDLLPGLSLGLIYGMTQQFRGAHFASHDLATILLCLWIPWVLSSIIWMIRKR
jgi:membrane-associated PAP2 superfamily phosphatase